MARFAFLSLFLLLLPARAADASSGASLNLPRGFKAERLRLDPQVDGAFRILVAGEQGRLLAGLTATTNADSTEFLRLVPQTNETRVTVERFVVPLTNVAAIAPTTNALLVLGDSTLGRGLYRLGSTNDGASFDVLELLFALSGKTEPAGTGVHSVGLNQTLRLAVRQHFELAARFETNGPYRSVGPNFLGQPTNAAVTAAVLQSDDSGRNWFALAGGWTGVATLASDAEGELFAAVSEAATETGDPRAVRLLHATSGARFGSGADGFLWPDHSLDRLPSSGLVEISAPFGFRFGTGGNFPERWRHALFIGDAARGKILAVHLRPKGSSFSAEVEEFATGLTAPLTALEFGRDGALYLATGWAGGAVELHRIRWIGSDAPDPSLTEAERVTAQQAGELRQLRRRLESLHRRPDTNRLDFVWSHLGNLDHHVRFAARVALEQIEVALWRDRALAERRPGTAFPALAGLVRVDGASSSNVLARVLHFLPEALSREQTLDWLRLANLTLARAGMPDAEMRVRLAARFEAIFPFDDAAVDRDLATLLAWLDSPKSVERTVPLLLGAATPDEQLHYARCLSWASRGWTPELRRQFFGWLERAASIQPEPPGFLNQLREIHAAAWNRVPENERPDLPASAKPAAAASQPGVAPP